MKVGQESFKWFFPFSNMNQTFIPNMFLEKMVNSLSRNVKSTFSIKKFKDQFSTLSEISNDLSPSSFSITPQLR